MVHHDVESAEAAIENTFQCTVKVARRIAAQVRHSQAWYMVDGNHTGDGVPIVIFVHRERQAIAKARIDATPVRDNERSEGIR
jgi:hypothetical protein